MRRAVIAFAAIPVALGLVPSAGAQCPNGSAPPCASAVAGRPDPPLDDHTWIVVPFTNTARASDLDWLSAASVDLIATDISRWTDLRAVDAERVTDLLRNVPEAGRTQLGLDEGLTIAKHAGAGRLVMGAYLKEGTRTTVSARVFNVRTGQRIRLVEEPHVASDSISAAYKDLTPKVLALTTPPGASLSGIGTSSTAAIKSYTLGMAALARGRRDSAAVRFLEAVRFDSTFALAHLRLGAVIGQSSVGAQYPGGSASALATARRLSSGLPERERLIINPDGLSACERGRRLLAIDSAAAEGWMSLGTCYYSNNRLVKDSAGNVRRQVSLDSARKAWERALKLQSTTDAVFGLQLALYPIRKGCAVIATAASPCPSRSQYWGALVLQADTLGVQFEPVRRFDQPARRRDIAAGRQAALAAGRDFFARWTTLHPEDIVAGGIYAKYLETLGDLAGAKSAEAKVAELGQMSANDGNRDDYYGLSAQTEWKLGHADRAAALIDSIVLRRGVGTKGWNSHRTAFARFSKAVGTSDTARGALAAFNTVYAGVVQPDFNRTMHALAAGAADSLARDILEVGTTLAFHTTRQRPAADTASEFSLFRFQAFLALFDTAHARKAFDEYRAWGAERRDNYWDGYEMFSAESALELGDTTVAWTLIEPFGQRWATYEMNDAYLWDPPATTYDPTDNLRRSVAIAGRAWLLYADLAMATGHTAEARRGYTMIVGMWQNGEAPVQPLVARAKAALAKLGG